VSSANRNRRLRNRDARAAAIEEAHRRAWRQRVTLTIVGIALAVVVGIVLVARATSHNGNSASANTTTSIAPSTSTTVPKPKRCVAMKQPAPPGTPVVPVVVGPPPKKLVTRDITVGTGAVVNADSNVTVDYVGVLCSTGKVFSTSYGSQPLSGPIANTIPGWQQGVPGMRVGGVRLLGIPPALGYGDTGTPDGAVPPDEPLWFLVKVSDAQAPTTTTAPATPTTQPANTTSQPAS
jgi:peptidylprolyl isomerase